MTSKNKIEPLRVSTLEAQGWGGRVLLKDSEPHALEALGVFLRKAIFPHWDSKLGEGEPEAAGFCLGVYLN